VADAHGAEVAYAANVIAAEIDEHDVFGALFFVGAQFLLQAQVFGFIFTALTSSGDGAVLKLVASNADQHFRRRAENGHVSHAEEVHIRRGIHAAQRTIDAERRHTGIKLKAQRRHGLKDVTVHDVFLDSLNGLEEAVFLYGDVDFQLALARFVRLEKFARQRLRELLFNAGNVTHGAGIGLLGRLVAHIGRGNDEDLMPNVVKRQQPVKEHEHAVRQFEVVFGSLREFFQLAHGIVRKEADGAGGERRQSGKVSRFVLTQQAVQNFKGIAFKLLARLTLFQRDVVAASAQHHIRTYAKESVAANFFAALYGFKQEGVGRALGVGDR